MKLQRLTLVVLILFVTGLIPAMAGEAPHSTAGGGQVPPPEGTSCPNPGSDGDPFGPACPCACCPGHATTAEFLSFRPSLEAPPSDELALPLPDALHPKGVLSHIFHPPRV